MTLAHPEIKGLTDWRPLARGGFATVWQARQETLNRFVAVKVDQRTLDSDKERRRFLREAGAAGRMSGHPGIVTVHDAGLLPDGRPYLVMALCPGGSLTSWLKADQRPTQEQVRDVGVRIADALAAAHEHGVLHRDVKPANIMIDAYGQAGLADFGLAAMPQPGQDVSVTMEALTPAYAPKEVLYQRPPSQYGDVFSLAATLYALLDGKPPRWPETGTPSLPEVFELQSKPVQRLANVNSRFMDVLMRALADDAEDRPTAAEFRDELAAIDFSADDVPPATPPVAAAAASSKPTESQKKRSRRVPALIALVAVLLVGAVVGGMALANMRTPSAGPTTGAATLPISPSDSAESSSSSSASSSGSPSASPSGSPSQPPPPGFIDCSDRMGVDGALCPTEPECWMQFNTNFDNPAVATPTRCDQSHTNETFAAGRINYRVRLQSQLNGDPFVKKLCSKASLNKLVPAGVEITSAWGVDAAPPQISDDPDVFRCLFYQGTNFTSPLKLRTFR